MANVGMTTGDPQDSVDPNASAALNQAIAQGQAQNDLAQQLAQAQNQYNNLLNSYGGGLAAASKYAPYDVGNGMTKWDEFVQQMQLENQKLTQAQSIETARLAQEKALADEKLQEEQKIADQNTVEAYNKNLTSMQGPKDPYGYLFASRGLSAPQGYAPTAAPIPQAVLDQYKSEGVDLQQAQQQLVGGSGPSFISGYLGGMPKTLQQGPMGFQNAPSMANVAPGSQPQPQQPPGGMPFGNMPGGSPNTPPSPSPATPPPGAPPPTGQPMHMATGGTVPGYAPGQDSVPAMLSPGEGILKPQAVQAMGGPSIVNQLNAQSPSPVQPPVQHFADGGFVNPGWGMNPGQQAPQGAGYVFGGVQSSPYQPAQPTTITPTQSGSNYQIAGQNVGQNSVENAPGMGYTMTAPGVANPGSPFPQGPSGIDYVPHHTHWQPATPPGTSPFNIMPPTGLGAGQAFQPGQGMPWQGGHMMPWGMHPVPGQFGPGGLTPTFNPATNPGVSQLTGGIQTGVGPAGGPPMNLNMLDPYTRSMVDQYGVPQIPSAQALANMPQSGLDAYQNYVEKVAGGNFQDLLDQSKNLNPAGENPANMKFT